MTDNLKRQVAVTGIGIISSIGVTAAEVSDSLRLGRSGIVMDPERKSLGFRSGLTGKVKVVNPAAYGLDNKALRTMGEPALYGHCAATDAVAGAALSPELLGSGRCGLVFGNDSCIRSAAEAVDILRKEKGTRFVGSGRVFQGMNSSVTMNLGVRLGIRGACWTLSAACASGAHAVGQGVMLIRSGLQDVVVTGGAQETGWESMVAFDALNAFSLREDAPQKASRPFDRGRDGLVPSGGGACLVLEDLEHALKRKAPIRAVIRGYGFSSDGKHLSVPSSEGSERAVRQALDDAGIAPEMVGYINAHATSTPIGDAAEAKMINRVFGTAVPVSSTKSMTGHECWMAGASELIYCILMAEGGFIAPNINFEEADPDCAGINVVSKTHTGKVRYVLSNSFGFGGTNAAIILDFDINRIRGEL
ncbi:MAG TPA: beta-ketoacyl synthase [Elusimicrobia bacterium]|nr:beta-ketoacyl synthase [Elusimicrobiota bacterium]